MRKTLKTIAVDLTPVLPGGENGGAKIFVLELLRRLAVRSPETQFVLLTQAASHHELAEMDRPNVRRMQVVGTAKASGILPGLVQFGSRVLRHLPGRMRNLASHAGYQIHTALKRSGSGALLRDIGADLLFCPFTAPTFFEPEIPTVCTIYDLQYKTYPEFFTPEDVAHRDRTFIEACKKASHLAAISDYSRDSAILHGDLDSFHIRTIHLRMARRVVLPSGQATEVLSQFGLLAQQYLVYPANFWKHKNHEMLLTAFGMAALDGMDADIKLVCTGAPGARQEWLRAAARAMDLEHRVLFPGYLPNRDLAALIGAARGVVFPSLYEGFGLPVIEAMAAGVPVACSNTTSLPEVAADAAIMFDPRIPAQIAAAIRKLVEDDDECRRLVAAGVPRAIEFSDSERMADEYWQLFQDAVANTRLEDSLIGCHADGWLGTALKVQVKPSTGEHSLELEISVPDWVPQSRITLQTYRSGIKFGGPLHAGRGAHAKWSIPLAAAGGYYEIRLNPPFIPSKLGLGDDIRELTAMLDRCTVRRTTGDSVDLVPQKAPS